MQMQKNCWQRGRVGWSAALGDIIVSSNLTMAALLCPREKHFTAIYLLGCRLVEKMRCNSSAGNYEAGLNA